MEPRRNKGRALLTKKEILWHLENAPVVSLEDALNRRVNSISRIAVSSSMLSSLKWSLDRNLLLEFYDLAGIHQAISSKPRVKGEPALDEAFILIAPKGMYKIENLYVSYAVEGKKEIFDFPSKDLEPNMRFDPNFLSAVRDREKTTYETETPHTLCQFIRTGIKTRKVKPDDARVIEAGLVTPANLNPYGYLEGKVETIEVEASKAPYVIQKGDVLMVGFGGNVKHNDVGSIGRTAMVNDLFLKKCDVPNLLPGNFLIWLRPRFGVNPTYLTAALNSKDVQLQVRMLVKKANANQFLIAKHDVERLELKKRNPEEKRDLSKEYGENMVKRLFLNDALSKILGFLEG